MSAADEERAAETMLCCANCGKAEIDDVKLKFCTACKLVKYCSVECQKNHRKQHKKACKKKAAELRDDRLFTQPAESHLGECPICCLPLSLDPTKSTINSCCCKYICKGCDYANYLRETEENLEPRCPYCREPVPKTDEEGVQNYMNRVKANDPIALRKMGQKCGHEGDYEGAFKYYTKAAILGDAMAHFNLSIMHYEGKGVEKNNKKDIYHLEEAAIGGHPSARHNLGCEEKEKGRIDRALKHWIIAANLGHDEALAMVKQGFQIGDASKEEYASSLRGHQAAVDATKSMKRTEAEVYHASIAREAKLFTQPEISYLGECSICCLPLPLDESKSTINTCCSQRICIGCDYANKKREAEQRLEQKCAFCREPLPDTDEEIESQRMKRIKANDPVAIRSKGQYANYHGDYEVALEYLTKAAELGDAYAHYQLAGMYHEGEGVEKDEKKKTYHLEEAAIGGHPEVPSWKL